MKIILSTPHDPRETIIETEQYVTIVDPYIGPVLTHDGVCLSVFARDDGFEILVWKGDSDLHTDETPKGSLYIAVHPDRGVTVLSHDDG